jgi:hypothetical protein
MPNLKNTSVYDFQLSYTLQKVVQLHLPFARSRHLIHPSIYHSWICTALSFLYIPSDLETIIFYRYITLSAYFYFCFRGSLE